MIIAGHTGIQNTKSLFPLHRYQRSVQLQFYISRAERHITNNYFSRPLKSPWPIQNWEVGVSPIWFYGVPVLSRPHSGTSASEGGYWCNFFPPTSPSENTSPSAKCKSNWREQRKRAIFHTQKKEGKGRRRKKGQVFKFRYLLTETEKNTHTAPRWQKSQQSELRSFASSQCLSRASQ